jgi:hypothetical protein
MYSSCRDLDLPDAWAYMWSSWYRPGRWHLWARSSYSEISIYRMTMAAESGFNKIKNKLLGKRRRDAMFVLETIDQKMVPECILSISPQRRVEK